MNGGLLNIWREIGAYLRYADAKCIFLSGASLGVLVSYIQYRTIVSSVGWSILGNLAQSDISISAWVAILLFFVAFLSSSLAALPSLSKKLVRVRAFIGIGNFFSSGMGSISGTGVIYFRDIATFRSGAVFEAKVKKAMAVETSFSAAETELCEQIWIVSRISTAKFYAANISIAALLAGIVFAIW